ncbi:hypothetical protein C8J57DRAFT_1482914 [Mycena rebaudengoi]|nr:hypothetical protein C8J57DRAFT_1482914 [Mycena rebaudengoi]
MIQVEARDRSILVQLFQGEERLSANPSSALHATSAAPTRRATPIRPSRLTHPASPQYEKRGDSIPAMVYLHVKAMSASFSAIDAAIRTRRAAPPPYATPRRIALPPHPRHRRPRTGTESDTQKQRCHHHAPIHRDAGNIPKRGVRDSKRVSTPPTSAMPIPHAPASATYILHHRRLQHTPITNTQDARPRPIGVEDDPPSAPASPEGTARARTWIRPSCMQRAEGGGRRAPRTRIRPSRARLRRTRAVGRDQPGTGGKEEEEGVGDGGWGEGSRRLYIRIRPSGVWGGRSVCWGRSVCCGRRDAEDDGDRGMCGGGRERNWNEEGEDVSGTGGDRSERTLGVDGEGHRKNQGYVSSGREACMGRTIAEDGGKTQGAHAANVSNS